MIPARNAASTVARAITSVLSQSFSALELLLIDDGSTDDTVDRALGAAFGDVRLRVLRSPPLGVVAAANLGLTRARAPLVARLDADDAMLPRRLERQWAALAAMTDVVALGTHVEHVPDPARTPGADDGMARYVAWLNERGDWPDVHRNRFIESPLCNPSTLVRRDVVVACGGYVAGAFPEDYELWLRLVAQGHRIAVLPEVLTRWFDSGGRLTRVHPSYATATFAPLKARYLAPLCRDRGVWIVGAGRDGRRLARALVAEHVPIHGFVDADPRKIGGFRRGDRPIVATTALPHDGALIVSAVGIPGARAEIRAWLLARGEVEGETFTCAA